MPISLPPGDTPPIVATQVSWSTNPDTTPVWVNLDNPAAATPHPMTSISTSRGRGSESDESDTGNMNLDVANPGGDFTPENTAGQYYPNVTLDKRIRTVVTPPYPYDGTTYSLFDGHINDLPVTADDGGFDNGSTALQALDYFEALGVIELLSAYDHEVLATSPVAYYPMSDVLGTNVAGNTAGTDVGSGELTYRGTTGGQYKFAGAAQLPADPGGSLELAPAQGLSGGLPVTKGGYQVRFPKAAFIARGAFSVAFTITQNVGLLGVGVIPIEQWGSDGGVQFRVIISGSAFLFLVGDVVSGTAFSISTLFADGLTHAIVCTVDTDLKTLRLYCDGALVGTTVMPSAYTFSATTAGLQVGSGDHTLGDGSGTESWVSGRVSKVALWDRRLTATEIQAQHAARNGFDGEASGARQHRILDYAGFPSARRSIDPGESTCGPLLSTAQVALPLLQNVNRTEQGFIFMAGDGDYTSFDRARTRNTVSRVTLGTSTLPVETDGMQFGLDKGRIRNIINATRPNGPTIRLTNQASIDAHRRRTSTVTYEVQTDGELRHAAQWDLFLYANPKIRMSTLVLDPFTAPALWPWALGLELGDRITVSNLPVYAPASSMDFIVQAIAHDGAIDSWRTTLQLSPVVVPTLRADAAASALTPLDSGLVIPY